MRIDRWDTEWLTHSGQWTNCASEHELTRYTLQVEVEGRRYGASVIEHKLAAHDLADHIKHHLFRLIGQRIADELEGL